MNSIKVTQTKMAVFALSVEKSPPAPESVDFFAYRFILNHANDPKSAKSESVGEAVPKPERQRLLESHTGWLARDVSKLVGEWKKRKLPHAHAPKPEASQVDRGRA
jgi:hypothetical protein